MLKNKSPNIKNGHLHKSKSDLKNVKVGALGMDLTLIMRIYNFLIFSKCLSYLSIEFMSEQYFLHFGRYSVSLLEHAENCIDIKKKKRIKVCSETFHKFKNWRSYLMSIDIIIY